MAIRTSSFVERPRNEATSVAKSLANQALFFVGSRLLLLSSDGVANGTIRVVPALLMRAQDGCDFVAPNTQRRQIDCKLIELPQ
ncbi:hypothetical protein [Ancylobacter sp. G4_0304]|uniref:hypothetical protein n=1 Tax=Ancylobacter sp. G4_0304 TaxID=3114289 RepID=UPI0039C6C4DD